jgi:hypothetical protein
VRVSVEKAPRLGFFNWRDDMKRTLVVLLAAVASCSGNSETPRERLIGQWLYTNSSGGAGVDATFNLDDTYSVQTLQLTSDTAGNDEVETGVFSATDTEITFAPQKHTCPGPDPVYTLTYHFTGDSLVVVFPDGAIALSRNTTPPSSNAIVTFGCFQSDGSFVTAPLAAVSN